jgi:NADH-quinone oxidoreductase subunit G
MAEIRIDGKTYEADASKNLLDVCLSLGLDLPYFCWHPALGSVGACRQCAVKQYKDEADERGRLVMACMTPAADGTRISIADGEARDFRAGVIEWLMVNHPHDCPVCDEGGECHLQDMTVMTGHNYRRYRFKKRTYRNQDLGPLVNHEMNRCIQCYRCVRFYGDHAGGDDLRAFGAHDHVYFGRHQDGTLESPFSGNLVEVCPTGVFTDKTLKQHYARKWDLQTAPSVCVHCALGCNTTPGERYGELRRVRGRYHGRVNGYFLCDRGRYGYGFTSHERRLRHPLLPQGAAGPAEAISADAAARRLAELVKEPGRVIGVGSPRASLEANFALKSLVGEERFFAGVGADEQRLVDAILDVVRRGPARVPSLREVERCDAALVLGEDVTETAPMLDLALRQAVRRQPARLAGKLQIPVWNDAAVRETVQDERGPLYLATPASTRLDGAARRAWRAAPEDVARLGFAVAHELDAAAPAVAGLAPEVRELAAEVAAELAAAERPLVVSGAAGGSLAVVHAAANVAWALGKKRGEPAEVFYALPECNSLGLALLGARPLEDAFTADADVVVILENDLYRRAGAAAVDRFLDAARHLVVIDHLAHDAGARAELVLPAATFAEGDGTLVSNEGRAQRYYQVHVPRGEIRESWRWLAAAGWENLDDVVSALAASDPAFAALPAAAPSAGFRRAGSKLPRALHRYSGRTAMTAHLSVHEPKPVDDPDTPFNFSMEGWQGPPSGALAAEFWAPGWNSIQALNRFQEEVAGPLRAGDPGARLIEPSTDGADYFTEVPPAFARRQELRLVPLHHLFGSEELSVLSPGIAELVPQAYLALNPEDAAELGLDGAAELELDGRRLALPVRRRPELPRGVAGVPRALPDLALPRLPEWALVRKGGP